MLEKLDSYVYAYSDPDTIVPFYIGKGNRVFSHLTDKNEGEKINNINEIKNKEKEIEILEYVSTIENFFDADDMPYHEIMFVYKVDFKNDEDKKIIDSIKNIEGEDELRYDWIDLDKIEEYPLKPQILKSMIKNKNFSIHEINDDRK